MLIRALIQKPKKGLGTPNGLFAALDAKGWMLVTSVAAVSKGLPWPCAAPSCLASAIFAAGKAAGWHTLRISARNTTASISIDGEPAHVVQLDLTQGYATGSGGFASLVAPHMPVMFDNFTVDVSPAFFKRATSARGSSISGINGNAVTGDGAWAASQCTAKPAAGQKLISIGCGEASAALGSKWQVHGGDGGVGPISLRSDPTLCLSSTGSLDTPTTPTPLAAAGARLPVGGIMPPVAPAPPPPPPMPLELAACDNTNGNQLFQYSAVGGSVRHVGSGAYLQFGAGLQHRRSEAQLRSMDRRAGSGGGGGGINDAPLAVWWSPDLAMGYLHGDSNHPMQCPCLAVCG